MCGMVASPTPMIPISSDSTRVTSTWLSHCDSTAAVIQPAVPPPTMRHFPYRLVAACHDPRSRFSARVNRRFGRSQCGLEGTRHEDAFITCLVAALAGCTAPPPVASNAPIAEIAGTGGRTSATMRRRHAERRVFRRQTATPCSFATGEVVWVNRLQGGCGGFGQWDVIVTEPIGTQHCRGDLDPFVRSGQQDPGPELPAGRLRPLYAGIGCIAAAERAL